MMSHHIGNIMCRDSIPKARIRTTKKSGSMNEVMISSIVLKTSDRLDLYIAIVQWLFAHEKQFGVARRIQFC